MGQVWKLSTVIEGIEDQPGTKQEIYERAKLCGVSPCASCAGQFESVWKAAVKRGLVVPARKAGQFQLRSTVDQPEVLDFTQKAMPTRASA
jgi:hypothetical protein